MDRGFKRLHQSIKKRKTGYIVALVLSCVVLMLFSLILVLGTTFFPTDDSIVLPVLALGCVVIGGMSVHFIRNITQTTKGIVWAGCVAFIPAILISVYLSVVDRLAHLSMEKGIAPRLFTGGPNGLVTGLIIIVFYNVFIIATIFRHKKRNDRELLPYLAGLIVFLILYFAVPGMFI
ncbi:MAG: hypothetical protein KJ601_06105 [Nanoarchaeota archaeon]|nr:hypothetical protein [Nanoarchaeota archaeon]MBU1703838.1 hypothetical protein [Nanoarchaeota archaeon]